MTESHSDFYERWSAAAGPYFGWQFEQFAPHVGKRAQVAADTEILADAGVHLEREVAPGGVRRDVGDAGQHVVAAEQTANFRLDARPGAGRQLAQQLAIEARRAAADVWG